MPRSRTSPAGSVPILILFWDTTVQRPAYSVESRPPKENSRLRQLARSVEKSGVETGGGTVGNGVACCQSVVASVLQKRYTRDALGSAAGTEHSFGAEVADLTGGIPTYSRAGAPSEGTAGTEDSAMQRGAIGV